LVNVLSQGDFFGEIALITNTNRYLKVSSNALRTASVICLEDSHFMTIQKSSFQHIIEKFKAQIESEKITRLRSFPLF
jgi:CRP-like cAMP-binding protein